MTFALPNPPDTIVGALPNATFYTKEAAEAAYESLKKAIELSGGQIPAPPGTQPRRPLDARHLQATTTAAATAPHQRL